MTTIPRDRVALALGASAAALPPGDLPLARLAERYAVWVAAAAQEREVPDHVWTFVLVDWLVQHDPALGWAAIRTTLDLCTTPDEVAMLAAGPTEDLLRHHGAAVIDAIVTAAAAPRVRYLLSGLWQDDLPALLWARIVQARATGPDLDAGDPLPAVAH